MSAWVRALRIWNNQNNPDIWCVPRRGTDEYKKVLKIMGKKPATKKKVVKVKKTPKKDDTIIFNINVNEKVKKTPTKKKVVKVEKTPTKVDNFIDNLKEESIETTDNIIEVAPVPINNKNAVDIKDCLIKSNGIMDIIYGKAKLSMNDVMVGKLKIKRDLQSIIESSDFFPTPPEYADIIINDVAKRYDDVNKWVDIASGLGSLSLPAIEGKYPTSLNIENVLLFEKEQPFVEVLKCYEKTGFVEVRGNNYFNYNLDQFIDDKERTVIVSNPPFRGFFDGKNRGEFWAYFVYSVLRKMDNYKHTFYAILPNSKRFKSSNRRVSLSDSDIGKQVSLEFDGKLWKDLKQYFGDEDEDEIFTYDYVTYISPVTGFKKIGKNGKPKKMGLKAILVRFGI